MLIVRLPIQNSKMDNVLLVIKGLIGIKQSKIVFSVQMEDNMMKKKRIVSVHQKLFSQVLNVSNASILNISILTKNNA